MSSAREHPTTEAPVNCMHRAFQFFVVPLPSDQPCFTNGESEIAPQYPSRLLHQYSSRRDLGTNVRHASEVHARGARSRFAEHTVCNRFATGRSGSAAAFRSRDINGVPKMARCEELLHFHD